MSKRKKVLVVGVKMTGLQYEALCRYALSVIFGIPIERIFSGFVSGPWQRRQKLRHQIDLYWDTSDGVLEYRVFANARWSARTLETPDVMELIGVWRDIGAHKAMLITNVGFDPGVISQAEQKGIALLVVRPVVDLSGIGTTNLAAVVEEVVGIAKGREEPVFESEIVHKAWEGTEARRHGGTEGRSPEAAEDWMEGGWTSIGGGGEGGGGGGISVPNKGMGAGRIRNKMMGN